ncbi:Oidioi.mRNA.OKI2018_I69.chr1.g2437.t1.cds [Oikopleura dioica]|uniref:Oidioi.mRNA.OKI2018_I69.chr1.g2437.t1.cds n=1 Tax=Oikopleura dioica TaxID=34765 RepID=A0ABN7SR29_OIKDI|nr:Oidioi.mRNA.OKI2018_I69.chr1.g2437.t1.cds [Oikopleura dioica]
MTSAVESLISSAKSKDDQIDRLRGSMEAERHWLARKQFLLKNWDDYTDENREKLECLSQCWSGLHFLGVGYPLQVVEKIREMSFGLPNMSDMLKDADREIHSREVRRRRDEQAKVITLDNQNSRKRPAEGDLPPPVKPNAKHIGLFLNLSSYCRKQGEEAKLAHCVSMQKQRVTFLSEECPPEQIEEMEKFYERPISACDEVVEISIINTFIAQAVAPTREEAKRLATEQAIKILQKTPLVVVSCHRKKANGKIVSELCVSNSRGAKGKVNHFI